MGKVFESIDEKLKAWLPAQRVFFVATAPLSVSGHVNCSPKDGASFRVIDERTVVYLDLTGSGVETIAHVRENERIVLMFCGIRRNPKNRPPPRPRRNHRVESSRVRTAPIHVPVAVGIRSFIKVHLTRISDSCGYGVPIYEFRGYRPQLESWAEQKGEASLVEYRLKHNSQSIDRLEGVGSDRNGAEI
jgi:hypothetical protein